VDWNLRRKSAIFFDTLNNYCSSHVFFWLQSDDSTRYRDKHEIDEYGDKHCPVKRVEKFLKDHEWVTDQDSSDIRDEEKMAVLKAMGGAERRPKPHFDELFNDVYCELTPHLEGQKAQLQAHLKKYKSKY
jgi:TPP-dependent pyruvate/acetoin dehydrogenase alpha subunit